MNVNIEDVSNVQNSARVNLNETNDKEPAQLEVAKAFSNITNYPRLKTLQPCS